eukprot:CCRYP_011828-RA/>CCRYP_011828-RA protein AED:0.63 eAED:0.77 QI:0/0/0/1/1/1/2/0/301
MPLSTSNAKPTKDNVNLSEGTFARLDGCLDNLVAADTTERTTLQSLMEANAALVANVTALTTSVASFTAAYTTMAAIHCTGSAPPIAPMQQPNAHEQTLGLQPPIPPCPEDTAGRTDSWYGRDTLVYPAPTKQKATKMQRHVPTLWVKHAHPTAQTSPLPTQEPVATTSYPRHHLPTSMPMPCAPPSELQQANHYSTRVQPPSTCRPHLQVPSMATLSRDSLTTSSVSTLCNAGCTAHFTANTLTITDPADAVILSGTRDMHTPRLWQINLAPPQHSLALHIAQTCPTWAPTTRAQPPPTH